MPIVRDSVVFTVLTFAVAAAPAALAQSDSEGMPHHPMMKRSPEHHAAMMQAMQERQQRLDELVERMEAAESGEKVDAVAAVVKELVAQRRSMLERMQDMHERMQTMHESRAGSAGSGGAGSP